MTASRKTLLPISFWFLLHMSHVQAAPTPQQTEPSSVIEASNVTSADAVSSSSTSASGPANVTSGISNAELIGYAAAGIAALLAIAVGGMYYKKRRRRRQAIKDKAAMGQSDLSGKESFETLRRPVTRTENREVESPIVDRNLAGRGTVSNSKSHLGPVGLGQVHRKVEQGSTTESDSEDGAQPQKPRRARRPKRRTGRDRKRQHHSDSSDTATDSSTDESVNDKRR